MEKAFSASAIGVLTNAIRQQKRWPQATVPYFYCMKRFLPKSRGRRWALLVMLVALAIGIVRFFQVGGGDYIFLGVIYHLSLAPLYYVYCIWLFYLTDRLFARRQFAFFWLSVLASMAGTAGLAAAIMQYMPANSTVLGFGGHFFGLLFLGTATAILRMAKHKMGREAELVEQRAARQEAELKLLKQQINPHFLFNTLNSIHLKCLENKEEAGEMVLQLGDLLRYQLEQGNRATVTLREELAFVDNYVFFEKRRLAESISFRFTQAIDSDTTAIVPNLLITLVENAFKHGVVPGQASFIHIDLRVNAKVLELITTNSCSPSPGNGRQGTGLNNLRQRLALQYPGRHELLLAGEAGIFTAQLRIFL
jgi:hypothetical protein